MNVVAILICIFLYGFSSFFRKLAVEKLHPLQVQMIAAIVYVGLVPIYAWYLKTYKIENYDRTGIALTFIMVLLYTIANVIFGFTLRRSNALGVMSAMISISPVITLILSILFLNEQITLLKIIGAVVSIIGIFLLAL